MKWREVQVDLKFDEKRKGLHLSSIIKSICIGLDPKRFGGGPTTGTYARFEFGFMLEDLLARRRRPEDAKTIRLQVPIEKDGIAGRLDGFDFGPKWRVLESKSTEMSPRDPITHPKFRHWLWQIMGYCHMMDTNDALLEVFFIKHFFDNPLRAWELTFTRDELEENWFMLLNHKEAMKQNRVRR